MNKPTITLNTIAYYLNTIDSYKVEAFEDGFLHSIRKDDFSIYISEMTWELNGQVEHDYVVIIFKTVNKLPGYAGKLKFVMEKLKELCSTITPNEVLK